MGLRIMIYKFYSPLKVELEDDDFGDYIELDSKEILECYDIIATKVKEYNSFLNERGLMEYYNRDEIIKKIVESAVPMIGVYEGNVYGIMLVKTKDDTLLTAHQFRKLKDYFTGQYSDGWGEGFEQREIKTHIGTIYVHFWQSDNFFIKEENEMKNGIYYNEGELKALREIYPKGTIVQLIEDMEGEVTKDGKSTMPAGLKGKVTFVDDIGDIHVDWENGSSLAIIHQIDDFKIIEQPKLTENFNIQL